MKCPECSAENPSNAKFCIECGGRLRAEDGTPCPRCGAGLPTGARFCPSCGTAVGQAPAAGQAPTTGREHEAGDAGMQSPERPGFIARPEAPEQPESPGRTEAPARSTAEAAGSPGPFASIERLAPKQYIDHLMASSGKIAGERRVVTILFSDIKGSTALAERLDPEDVMEIMNGAFEVLIEPIYRYEGTLARLMGDAVLAFFGAPISHEDDPARACRAALDIIERTRAYANKLEYERGITGFDVRVGINTGLVVVGEVGTDLRVEYTAMGDAVNLAKRMESSAAPGTVLISESTNAIVSSLFETDPMGLIRVKGREKPEWGFRLLRPKCRHEASGHDGEELPCMVGRDAERSRLLAVLGDLGKGRGRMVALTGGPGLGKSRLITEAYAHRPAARWVEIDCASYTREESYGTARRILHILIGADESAAQNEKETALRKSLDRICRDRSSFLLEERERDFAQVQMETYQFLARLLGIPLDASRGRIAEQGHTGEMRHGTAQAFRRFIGCTARSKPLVLVCEDMHWIDPLSLELLEAVAPLTGAAPLLLLAAFRTDEGAMRDFHSRMKQSNGEYYEEIELHPLDRNDSASLLADRIKGARLPNDVVDLILRNAEGSPFYLEEIARSLREANPAGKDGGPAVTIQHIKETGIPTSLRGAIMSRIDGLPPQEKQVIQAASVIGRVFNRNILASTVDPHLAGSRLDESLERLCRLGFVELRPAEQIPEAPAAPTGMTLMWRTQPLRIHKEGETLSHGLEGTADEEYHFKNTIAAEVAYGSMLKQRRQELHGRTGNAMEQLYHGRREGKAPILAYHFRKGEVLDKAFRYLLLSARLAARIGADTAAVDAYRRVQKLAAEKGSRLAAEVDNFADELTAATEELGDIYYLTSDYENAVEQYEKAHESIGDSARRAPIYRKMGHVCEKWDKYNEAKRFFEKGLEELGGRTDTVEAAYLFTGLGLTCYHLDELEEAEKLGLKAVEITERIGDERGLAQCCNNLGIIYHKAGRLDRALEYNGRSLSLWERLGDTYGLAVCHNNLGLILKTRGDMEDAIGHFEKSLELFERLGNEHGLARVYDNLGQLYDALNEKEKAVGYAQKAFAILKKISAVGETEMDPEMWQSGMW